MSFRTFAAALVAAALFAAPALAQEATLGSLKLTGLWTRATPPGAPTASGYLTIANSGSEPDRLIAASSPLAGRGELHVMEMKDNVSSMSPVEGGIEIPAGGTVTLAPGGLHIMFVALKEPLAEGGRLPVTLTFGKAGSIDTFLDIRAVGASGMDSMPGMKMDAPQTGTGTR